MGDAELLDALATSQRLGMVGAQPLGAAIEHAAAFVGALADTSGRVLDLGSGGGLPGLVIVVRRPDLHVVLLDRRASRTDHLRRLVLRLGVADRVEVITADAAEFAADVAGGRRQPFDAVVARSFAAPRDTLAAARPLVRSAGIAVVSDPPTWDAGRWPDEEVSALGWTRRAWADRRVVMFEASDVPRGTRPRAPSTST